MDGIVRYFEPLSLDGLSQFPSQPSQPDSLHVAGDNQMLADANMGGNKVVNMADGTAATDGATVGQLNAISNSCPSQVDLGVVVAYPALVAYPAPQGLLLPYLFRVKACTANNATMPLSTLNVSSQRTHGSTIYLQKGETYTTTLIRSRVSYTYPPPVFSGAYVNIGLYDFDTGDLVAQTDRNLCLTDLYLTTLDLVFYSSFLTPFTATKNGLYIILFTFDMGSGSASNHNFLFTQSCNSDILAGDFTYNSDQRVRTKSWFAINVSFPYTFPSNILGTSYNSNVIASANAPWIALA